MTCLRKSIIKSIDIESFMESDLTNYGVKSAQRLFEVKERILKLWLNPMSRVITLFSFLDHGENFCLNKLYHLFEYLYQHFCSA